MLFRLLTTKLRPQIAEPVLRSIADFQQRIIAGDFVDCDGNGCLLVTAGAVALGISPHELVYNDETLDRFPKATLIARIADALGIEDLEVQMGMDVWDHAGEEKQLHLREMVGTVIAALDRRREHDLQQAVLNLPAWHDSQELDVVELFRRFSVDSPVAASRTTAVRQVEKI